MFDLVSDLHRWIYRTIFYTEPMRDEYPLCRGPREQERGGVDGG